MLRIIAIMMGHNCAPTLARVLQHLHQNNIEVAFIDHGSTDATSSIIKCFHDAPVTVTRHEKFDGAYRQARQLEIKQELISTLDADWFIHLDTDEILESPREGETLRAMIERHDKTNVSVIDCDEFVFAPHDEDENYIGCDYVRQMRRYYHFNPPNRKLQRVFRATCDVSMWQNSGGHAISLEAGLIAEERLRHRHYIGLSLDHLRQQYLGRVFSGSELVKGWHRNRVPMATDFIVAPPREKLFDLDKDGWRTDRPEPVHLIFHQKSAYVTPKPFIAPSSESPFPFIVGVGRSGTTLLRMMLDAHSELSIPPESHWLGPLIDMLTTTGLDRESIVQSLKMSHNWVDMSVRDDAMEALLDRFDTSNHGDLIRSIYRLYAARRGSNRYGDKTPAHLLNMEKIARMLPEARFIHIIRDGRDVAASYKGLWFGPGDDMKKAAIMWMWQIARARQMAEFLPHYMELRYEDLVTDTRAALQNVCSFINLDFEERQLHSHDRALDRLQELGPLRHKGVPLTAKKRQGIHLLTTRPPDRKRIGRWRSTLTKHEVAVFECVAGGFLTDLGYEISSTQ